MWKWRQMFRAVVVSGAAVVVCGGASGANVGTPINAVGGVGGNTVRTSNSSVDDWFSAGVDLTDDLWTRVASSNLDPIRLGDELWQSSGPEDSTQITTTVTGLNASLTYNVYVVYYTLNTTANGDELLASFLNWQVQAGIDGDPLTTFDSANGAATGANVQSGANFLNQRQALLGQISGLGSVSVNIDDAVLPTGDNRALYDGLVIEVVPAPGAAALLGVCGLAGARRRRSAF